MTLTHAERAERRAKIRQLVEQGHSRIEIAHQLGVSIGTVYGIAPVGRGRSSTTFEILADLINTRDTMAAIARRHHCTREWVRQVARDAREAGIEFWQRPYGRQR